MHACSIEWAYEQVQRAPLRRHWGSCMSSLVTRGCFADFGVCRSLLLFAPCFDALPSGILPIYQWLTSLKRSPPPTTALHSIERIQCWSMLLYYPLEHLYYLRSKDILPPTLNISLPFLRAYTMRLDTLKLALWSTRAWLLYILLQLAHLREDAKLLKLRSKSVAKAKGDEAQAEKAGLASRWDTWGSELVSNIGNLPLSIHWYVMLPLYQSIRCSFSVPIISFIVFPLEPSFAILHQKLRLFWEANFFTDAGPIGIAIKNRWNAQLLRRIEFWGARPP